MDLSKRNRHRTEWLLGTLVALLCLLTVSMTMAASPPLPYAAEYEARYGGFKASAERSLQNTEDGGIEMNTRLDLKLLGKTISLIRETSLLTTDAVTGEIRPLAYTFEQTGVGKRSRSVSFDWNSAIATAVTGKQKNTLTLNGLTMDNLSGYIALREQLLAGQQEVSFLGIDKGEMHEFHYQVIGEVMLETAAGNFRTLKLDLVRNPDSNRTTEIWLAPDWDYLLVKLVQHEPDAKIISLELTQATVEGKQVSPGATENADNLD
jgi:hypothetical protein